MNITSIAFPVLIAGIPAFVGAFFVVRYFRQKKMSVGASSLILGLAAGTVLVYVMPEGRISRGDYSVMVPAVLTICIIVGAVCGFVSRRRRNSS